MANRGSKKFGKRNLLLDAALTEFSQNNYEQASLNTILETSGVGKGNFYYHFNNKETLFLAVLEKLLQDKIDFLSAHSGDLEIESGIFNMLRVHGRLSEEFALTDPRIEGFLYRLSNELPLSLRSAVEKQMGISGSGYFEQLVQGALQRGEIRNDLSPEFITRLLSFLFSNFARIFIDPDKQRELDSRKILEDFDRYMDFIEQGLKKQDSSATVRQKREKS